MSDPGLADLMGGSPTAKFPTKGTTHEGEIIDRQWTQQKDMDGRLKTWDDGSPMMQHVFTLQTEERDDDIPGDTGLRRVFAKFKMRDAIVQAVRDTGHRGEVIGGHLSVEYVGDEKPKGGKQGPKLYRATFTPPEPRLDDVFEDDEALEEPF